MQTQLDKRRAPGALLVRGLRALFRAPGALRVRGLRALFSGLTGESGPGDHGRHFLKWFQSCSLQ